MNPTLVKTLIYSPELKSPFTISSNAFRTQEWLNLARDDVWRLRKTPPLVNFLVGWLPELKYQHGDGGGTNEGHPFNKNSSLIRVPSHFIFTHFA
jgi:hypothetical protein